MSCEIKGDVNFGNLKGLIAEMAKEYNVKVGLLGENGSEEVSENLDVAGLGAVQEFGATIPVTDKMRNFFRWKFGINLKKTTTVIKIPPRSFLRMPIEHDDELRKRVKKDTQYFSKEEISLAQEIIKEYGDTELLKELAYAIGTNAVDLILEAFETSGWGKWAPDSSLTVAQKGSSKPLLDTGRLKNSITFTID